LGDFFTEASGVDGLITIFCDFRQFSAKKLAFFSKTNVMIKILPSEKDYLALSIRLGRLWPKKLPKAEFGAYPKELCLSN
jgi:hypothetical protein